MKYKLKIQCIHGLDIGKKWNFELDENRKSTIAIGRLLGTHIRLKDSRISRSHCLVQIQKQKLVAIDLGSHHGTILNLKNIQSAKIYNGDQLKIGDTILRIEYTTTN